ncbi:hypothetical protein HUO09_17290 [Vibrio sp. Y2-5]|uniref:hypothetical protein n=1 Tax=Vibrio sp. Y2-5 TaxID=2743977 RepID=UPI001660F131|nr:hypothetical protein [Vibrio sp. Y2-5]MBD0788111.1 hypothetical protein [Vibrio sp. Y2-5]
MRDFLINFCVMVGSGLGMLILGGAICFGLGWVISILGLSTLIDAGAVASASQYWEYVQRVTLLILLPPIYIGVFRMLPISEQVELKEAAKVTGIALVYTGAWLGKVLFFAIGVYIFATVFK